MCSRRIEKACSVACHEVEIRCADKADYDVADLDAPGEERSAAAGVCRLQHLVYVDLQGVRDIGPTWQRRPYDASVAVAVAVAVAVSIPVIGGCRTARWS